jgi:hypothetical protein
LRKQWKVWNSLSRIQVKPIARLDGDVMLLPYFPRLQSFFLLDDKHLDEVTPEQIEMLSQGVSLHQEKGIFAATDVAILEMHNKPILHLQVQVKPIARLDGDVMLLPYFPRLQSFLPRCEPTSRKRYFRCNGCSDIRNASINHDDSSRCLSK